MRLAAIARDFRRESLRRQQRMQGFGFVSVVFDDQHSMHDQICGSAINHRGRNLLKRMASGGRLAATIIACQTGTRMVSVARAAAQRRIVRGGGTERETSG